jgi:pantoate--beta-alanine ligase
VKVLATIAELRAHVARFRDEPGGLVALVPTMGALHEGHLRLIDHARAAAELVVLSIFVNPLQFGPGEDLQRYPRPLDEDTRRGGAGGVDLFFLSAAPELYPQGQPRVRIDAGPMATVLCGATRPGHFAGVLTVVAKLCHIAQPDLAVFGRKDYQQAILVRRMVDDLDFPVRIDLAPTVRDPDGLALSSRNAYLSVSERERALSLSRGLTAAAGAFRSGVTDPSALCAIVLRELLAARVEPDYVELVDPDELGPVDAARGGTVLAVAGYVRSTRLIDNIILG